MPYTSARDRKTDLCCLPLGASDPSLLYQLTFKRDGACAKHLTKDKIRATDRATYVKHLVESLSALPSCLQKFLQFPRFFTPSYRFWRRTRIHRDPGFKIFFRRAVHVQSFQSPCTCTARPALPSDFIPVDRANQDLNNAFLDESLAQKEPKL